MKKAIATLLVIIFVLAMFTGCAKETGTATQTAATPATAEEATASDAKDGVQFGDYFVPKGDWVIGLSNSYYGNTWRHQMVESFVNVAEQAKQDGLIKDYLVQNGDNTVNAQIDQINSFILEGVDAIVVNAASSTALNSVLKRRRMPGFWSSRLTLSLTIRLSFAWTLTLSSGPRSTVTGCTKIKARI